jgi:hypothetical protein
MRGAAPCRRAARADQHVRLAVHKKRQFMPGRVGRPLNFGCNAAVCDHITPCIAAQTAKKIPATAMYTRTAY